MAQVLKAKPIMIKDKSFNNLLTLTIEFCKVTFFSPSKVRSKELPNRLKTSNKSNKIKANVLTEELENLRKK